MEIFGGFMVMLSILGFFLTVLWFILPFVVFAMKSKLDRTYELLEKVDRRLAALEKERGLSATIIREGTVPPVTGPDVPPAGSPPPAPGE